ncbi:MAG: 4Fe-4S dicluster domain-containing protein [Deltaproteobacteria bacterium]|nr:4Fe-4S dicluster domain-containing protein [Deltaproteobacteria bacterium]
MKILAKKDLLNVLKNWSDSYDVFAPGIKETGDIIFDCFDENTFTLDYGKLSLPQKSEFLPQSEVIFELKSGEYKEVITDNGKMLFGMRACDVMGMRQAGSFMTRDVTDPYYKSKEEGVLKVVMACAGPQNETCFCTTVGSGPFVERGFDLQFYDVGDEFLVEAESERGKDLIVEGPFGEIDDAEAGTRIEEFKINASMAVEEVPALKEAMNRLRDGSVSEKVWEYFGRKCIVCGGCAFVCPTCTCFNVSDYVTKPGEGLRVRSWDACLFGGFTREASGHNPRGTQALRLKRRHEHKLLYYNETDIQEGLCGCVGCGRCSDYCPVHIGTLEVVKAIAEA